MVKIHRLKKPGKNSGWPLEPGQGVILRGMYIRNDNPFLVFVDTFERKDWRPKKYKNKKWRKMTYKEGKLPVTVREIEQSEQSEERDEEE